MDATIREILLRRFGMVRRELAEASEILRYRREDLAELEELVATLTRESDAIEAALGVEVPA